MNEKEARDDPTVFKNCPQKTHFASKSLLKAFIFVRMVQHERGVCRRRRSYVRRVPEPRTVDRGPRLPRDHGRRLDNEQRDENDVR